MMVEVRGSPSSFSTIITFFFFSLTTAPMTCRTAAFFSLHLEKALEPSEGFPVTP